MLISPAATVEKECIRRLVTPLGLLYVAATLERGGYEVSVLDSTCDGYENLIHDGDYVTYGLDDARLRDAITAARPDAVGVSCSFSYQERRALDLISLVKTIEPGIVTFTGGIHPSFLAEKMLRDCPALDYVILREGEFRTLELFDGLNRDGRPPAGTDGLAFRDGDRIEVRPAGTIIRDIDSIPFPARHLVPMEKYIRTNKQANPFPRRARVERIEASRGCPCDCYFCAGSHYFGRFRMRGVDNIIEELRLLKETYNIEEIHFSDDNMTAHRARALELFRRMKEFGFTWCTPSGILMTTLNEEMVEAMADSGCYQVTLSPESGSQRVVDEIIKKPLKLSVVKPTVAMLQRHGIGVHSNFIVGNPGETREEIMRTFAFARESGFDSAAFFIAVPYPGTPLYEQCRARGWLKDSYATADFKHVNIRIPPGEKEFIMPDEELVALVERETREFNEWSKARNPEAWAKKYSLFLESHAKDDDSEKIMGRVV
jgi:radical SAM superfamily enzyme YgiQ (UPF0313 family)